MVNSCMITPTDIEKESLEAHVELCAERYRALEIQFHDVKNDITEVKNVVHEVHQTVIEMSSKRNDQVINWGIGIIGVLVATVGYLLITYVFK